jgi:tetratricopeptide (TPR) repeat protein
MVKPRLFIGSSAESVNIAYAAQQNLRHSAEVTVWDQGVFKLSATALESLLQILDTSDFGMFVFSPDDLLEIRGTENAAVRDNVILELGLFVGRLGRERCFILVPDKSSDLRIPTDMIGMTPGTYETDRSDGSLQAATGPACHEVRERIDKLGTREQRSESPTVNPTADKRETDEEAQAATVRSITESLQRPEASTDRKWMIAFLERKYDEALGLVIKRLAEESDPTKRLNLECYAARIKYAINPPTGIAELEKLIASYPDQYQPYQQLGYAYRGSNLQTEGLRVIDSALGKVAEKYQLLRLKAYLLWDIGYNDEGIQILREAISQSPTGIDGYIQLSDHFAEIEKYADAKVILEEAISTAPENEQVLSKFARLLLDRFEPKEALIAYNQLVSRWPNNPTYRTLRGNIYVLLELNDLAMRDYKQANSLAEPKEAWIIANIGNLFKNRGFYEEGIGFLKQALELEPNDDYAHQRLAEALRFQGEEEEKASNIAKEAKRTALVAKYGLPRKESSKT